MASKMSIFNGMNLYQLDMAEHWEGKRRDLPEGPGTLMLGPGDFSLKTIPYLRDCSVSFAPAPKIALPELHI